MLVFPWTRFEVDGQPVPPEQLRSWRDARVYPDLFGQPWTAVPVSAGTHTVQVRFEPNRTWRWLHRLSWAVLIPWFVAVGGLAGAKFVHGRRVPAVLLVIARVRGTSSAGRLTSGVHVGPREQRLDRPVSGSRR
jgi:hypothetical protein